MEVGGGISYHHLVEAKIRRLKRWCGRVRGREDRQVVKVSEVNKLKCKTDYEGMMKKRWEGVCGYMMEEEWSNFKKTVLKVTEEVFGTRKIIKGKKKRK